MTTMKLSVGTIIKIQGIPVELLSETEVFVSEANYKLLVSQDEHSSLNPAHAALPESSATSS